MNRDLQYEVEQFLYREARVLDEGRFHDWLELFTDDVRYWMPVRETLQQHPEGTYPEGQRAVALIDDDKRFLALRVARLDTGVAHAETPPSRTRHLITNVEIEDAGGEEINAHSNFLIFQGRREKSDYLFVGRREDRLRRVAGGWKIARRKIVLDQTVLPRGLSIFF
ncbi:MAG: 3-phenylpropionate/cinnamic acid dioxygenase subunit beta [Chloroflexi bacterium]|nr:3-phenylpropionate/cinnamic acid dioxygenase subunit beta [Chloroflexota bacterium]